MKSRKRTNPITVVVLVGLASLIASPNQLAAQYGTIDLPEHIKRDVSLRLAMSGKSYPAGEADTTLMGALMQKAAQAQTAIPEGPVTRTVSQISPPRELSQQWEDSRRYNVPTQPTTRQAQSTLEQSAGDASKRYARTTQELKESVELYKKLIHEAIARHEKAPRIDIVNEAERIKYFIALLEDTVTLGTRATASKDELLMVFASFKKAAGEAGPRFRQVQQHFEKKASEEQDEDSKQMYSQSAKFYAARAARCEVQAKTVVPLDFQREIWKTERKLLACRELLGFIRNDPDYAVDNSGSAADLFGFFKAFDSVNDVLKSWTTKLLEDLEPVKNEKANYNPRNRAA